MRSRSHRTEEKTWTMWKWRSRSNHCPILCHHLKLFLSTASATTPPPPRSFAVSYLIKNCGFSPEAASKATKRLRFETPEKPDSVFAFFAAHGFSHSQTLSIFKRQLRLLSCDPEKVVLPKLQFLLSKGATASEVVRMVTVSPRFLIRSLDNHLVPLYDFVRGFFDSDQQTVACLNRNSVFFSDGRVVDNAKSLLEIGVTRPGISVLFRTWPSVFCSTDLLKTVEELRELGFDPSTTTFGVALLAKKTVTKAKWDKKVEIFKKWGFSQEQVNEAFRKQPYCMLTSVKKIDAVFRVWVEELGFKPLDLLNAPVIFLFSLRKRVVPRATVVKFLISKGLRREDASFNWPFVLSEKAFLEKFVMCFEKESSHLMKLYNQKKALGIAREKKLAHQVLA